MTIFVFYVSAQIPNIEYFVVYGGLQAPGGISSFFSLNFPSNAVRIMSGDQFLTRVMTIFIKTHFYKLRRTHRRAVVAVVAAARGRRGGGGGWGWHGGHGGMVFHIYIYSHI